MEELYLKFPTIEDKENVLKFKQEFVDYGRDLSNTGGLDQFDTYEEWLKRVQNDLSEETCEEGRVPSKLYLSYRKTDNKLIGIIKVRPKLNEMLFQNGGHIGGCVCPSEENKGYGTQQLALALKVCKSLGLDKALITCKKTNLPSARTIVKNGGVLENEIVVNDKITQRYWVTLR